MRAVDDSGAEVSWWFAYKLPHTVYEYDGDRANFDYNHHTSADQDRAGYRYLMFLPGDDNVTLSDHDLEPDGETGAVSHTLAQIFGDDLPDTVGYVVYNDEFPQEQDLADAGADPSLMYDEDGEVPNDSSSYGHNKGVIGFDAADGTAFWMLHSFPRWPCPGQTTFPSTDSSVSSRLNYAQSFLCVSLKDLKAVDNIALMMRRFHEPQIIYSQLPASDTIVDGDASQTIGGLLAELYRLVEENGPTGSPESQSDQKDIAEEAGELTFQAWRADDAPEATTTFRLMAKSPTYGEDLWIDLVSHRLGVDLLVETWRRDSTDQTDEGALHTPHGTDDDGDVVEDASAVLLADLGWWFKESGDHAKWAVSKDDGETLVCVGDINRQSSQEKRGGGTLAFHDEVLAASLRSYLWLTEREEAGEAEIKSDSDGTVNEESDETDRQADDLYEDAARDAEGVATDVG